MFRKLLASLRVGRASIPFTPIVGQLLSVATDDGGYGVMKLLAVDPHGVHVRLYVQRFATRPHAGDLTTLTLGGMGPGHEGTPFSIGHMPLSYRSFAGWQPTPMGVQAVTPEEREGYAMWREANGGYF